MNWERKPFLDVVTDITSGNKKFQSAEYLSDGKYPIIDQGADIIAGYTNEYAVVERTKPIILFGDHTKKIQFVDYDFCLGADGVKVLNTSDSLLPKFLYYYLQTVNLPDVGYSRHYKFLKECNIPLPPLPIQQQIADTLDKADALRRKDQELLNKYDELAQAVFYEMFGDPVWNEKGWRCLNGNNYAERISVGVVVKPASYYVESGVKALRSLNVRENYIEKENLVYFSKEANDTVLEKSKLKLGDILIVRTGQPGRSAVVTKEFVGSNCIDLLIVTPKKGLINPDYLSRFFNSSGGRKIVSGNETGQVQKHLNVGVLNKTEIPIPPIEIQNQFSRIIGLINKQKSIVINNIKNSFALQKNCELF